ncbi:MAG TPA: hypothetical protein DGP25_02635, partial [Brevundimonas sp.]|nr:hypothetical protein [Brevundimonas sp.]
LPERAFDIHSNVWTRYTWENFSSAHADMTLSSVRARFFRPNMEADVNVEIAAVKIEEGATATVWTPSPFDAADSASAAATSASSAAASETAAGQSATAASGSATTAATKAGEASTFASQASTSAANANTAAINAGVSATSAASRAGGNIVAMGSFSDGTIGTWTGSVANVAVSGVPDGSTRALRSTGRDAYEGSLISGVWGGRRLRVSGYGVAPGPYPLRIGIHGQTAANGSHWVTMAASSANTNSWATFSGEIVVPADVNRLRPFIQSEGPQSATDHHVQVATLRIEDVTESASAANSAAVATSQAASASASAASAQISADLVASVNNQSGFNILPNSTFAEGFAGWSSSSWLYTTTAPVGPHAYVNLNGTNGLDSDYISINASLTYVLSADFRRLATSGNVVVDLACYGNTGGVLGYSSRAFVNTNTNFGEGARRFVKITSFPAGTTRVRVRVFGENLTGIQTNGAGVRQIKLEVGDSMTAWRDDSQLIAVDARASLALSTSVDAVTRLGQSAFELILAAGGSPAYIKALAEPGGSEIAFAATKLLLRNVVGDQIVTALELINGEAYFGAPVSVDISGRRLTIGPGFGVSNGLVLWFGPNTIALSAMSRTNGYFALGTDGRVYYGNAELGGSGKTSGVRTFSSGPGGSSVETTISGVQAGSQIGVHISVNGGSLSTNSNSNGSVRLYETAGGNTRLLFSEAVVTVPNGLQNPNGSWGIQEKPSAFGTVMGQLSGDVTYRAEYSRTSGSSYVQGAVINASVTITPPL